MENFTPLPAAAGGILIGISAVMLMALLGRVAGISGIAGSLVLSLPPAGERGWRIAFVAGAVIAPAVYFLLAGDIGLSLPDLKLTDSLPVLLIGGFLTGLGSRLGNGCTSGHGVCGIARFSRRSIAATVTFMVVAIATVTIARHVLG